MTEINNTKFYQFLAKYNSQGGWHNVADEKYGNDDNIVIKAEFRAFVNAEWNGEEGTLTDDLINSFWKSIDTNQSAGKIQGSKIKNLNAIDKNELAAMDKNLEVFVEFDQFIANNVKTPSVLVSTGAQWKTSVRNELDAILQQFISTGATGDLTSILAATYPAIANKNTAQYCAVEYQESLKNGILADYPDYKTGDDATLQGLIKTYVSTIDGNTDADKIKEDIKSIMNAYLATAGLGDGSDFELSTLGFDAKAINGIQIAVIAQTIKKDLAEEAKKYEEHTDKFNYAVQKFIEAKIQEGGSFETLKSSASEFAESKFKTQLDNAIAVENEYGKIEESTDPESFYQKLVAEFGETVAKDIAGNARYVGIYQTAVEEVVTQVLNGELELDKISDKMMEVISSNLSEFLSGGFDGMSIEQLNATYDKLATAADAVKDNDKSLVQHREAAIKYCDALAKKGEALKKLVVEAFGEDYTSAINEMKPGTIKSTMADLKAKALEFGDPASWKISNWTTSIGDSLNLNPGSTTTYSLSANIANGSKTISPDRITYKTNNSIATIENGILTIKAPTTDANYTLEIYAYVDGVKINNPKVINLTCKTKNAADMKSEGNILVDGQYMKDLISKHNHITQLTNWKTWDTFKSAAKETVKNIITQLVTDLTNAGYNTTKVNYAAQTTLNYYNAAIDTITDQQNNSNRNGEAKSMNFSYVDGNGQSKTSSDKYWQSAASSGSDAGYKNCGSMSLNSTGLLVREEYSGTNTYCLYVNAGILLNKFMNFMDI